MPLRGEKRRIWYERTREARNASRSEEYKRRRDVLRAYQRERGCIVCGEKDARCLQFHHRDPAAKAFNIMKHLIHYGMQRIWEEVAKCDVLCANCHLKHHGTEETT